jgi:hypothetical protein
MLHERRTMTCLDLLSDPHSSPQKPASVTKKGRIFFMHVSKTAGVSVSSFLSSIFRPDEICPTPIDGVWTHSPSDVAQYRLFLGHFCHDFIDGFQGEKIRLIMVRDPHARLVSLYDFWRSYSWDFVRTALPPLPMNGPAVAKSCSFGEFLTAKNPFVKQHVCNPVARQLLGTRSTGVTMNEGNAIDLSIRRLESFDWIGVSESFRASIHMLSELLGCSAPPTDIRLNGTYDVDCLGPNRELVDRTEPSPEEADLMREVSRLDRAIYQHALILARLRVGNYEGGARRIH